jgi:hypothetical protein
MNLPTMRNMQTHAKTAEKEIPLDAWASARFGEHAPTIGTLRRWARQARILPVPRKYGRTYYVAENARYIDPSDPSYARVYRESQTAQ